MLFSLADHSVGWLQVQRASDLDNSLKYNRGYSIAFWRIASHVGPRMMRQRQLMQNKMGQHLDSQSSVMVVCPPPTTAWECQLAEEHSGALLQAPTIEFHIPKERSFMPKKIIPPLRGENIYYGEETNIS